MRASSARSCACFGIVRALEAPDRPVAAWHAGTPVALALGLVAGLGVCAAMTAAGWFPPGVLRVAAVTTGHGLLLGTALGWAAAESRQAWKAAAPALLSAVSLLALAATAATLDPCGALAYLAIPAWLALLARRGRLAPLGVVPPRPRAAIALGVALGAVLGSHLVVSAVLTLRDALRGDGVVLYLGAVAYDVGANVPSGEAFFRGALFNRLQHRWSFWAAATLSTAAYLARYLIDPLLPKTVEAVVAAFIYLALLSVGNAGLLWWSGSLLPGVLSALVFFAAYRLLVLG